MVYPWRSWASMSDTDTADQFRATTPRPSQVGQPSSLDGIELSRSDELYALVLIGASSGIFDCSFTCRSLAVIKPRGSSATATRHRQYRRDSKRRRDNGSAGLNR